MMGLLDSIGIDGPDWAQGPALTQGLLALAQSRRRPFTGLLQALATAEGVMGQAKESDRKKQLEDEQRRQMAEERALRMQQLQEAIAERKAASQQGATDMGLLRGMMQPQAGPTPTGGNVAPTSFDPSAFLARGGSLGGVQNAMALNAQMQPQQKKRDIREVGGSLVEVADEGVKSLYTAPAKPEATPEALRTLALIYGEGTPAYTSAVQALGRKLTTHQPGVSVSYGAPVAGQDANGNPLFFQPSKDGAPPSIIPGIRPPTKDLPEGAQKQVIGAQNLQQAVANYVSGLKEWSNIKMLSPDQRAKMGTEYNNMMLQAKEAYNLGVLNGPDYQILQSVVADPTKPMSALLSNEALTRQAKALNKIAVGIEQTVLKSHGRRPGSQPGAVDPDDPLGLRGGG